MYADLVDGVMEIFPCDIGRIAGDAPSILNNSCGLPVVQSLTFPAP